MDKKINETKVINRQIEPLLEVRDLVLYFKQSSKKRKYVIRKTGFSLFPGEILSIIGESGSGKSVITSTLYGLQPKGAVIESGEIILNGQNVEYFTNRMFEKSRLRGAFISAVFQNPMTTLDPTMKIGEQIIEGIFEHKITNSEFTAYNIALDFLKRTKINNAEEVMKMYPHQLSGGMKQRCVIAAAFATKPKVMVLDEPTTALDPTVQAEILEIVHELSKEDGVGVIFISHDIGVVASISDRIAIMYAGQIVEIGKVNEIIWHPQHPYTWGLLSSMPDLNQEERLWTIPGAIPANLNDIKGDAFAPRNEFALGIDFLEQPPLTKLSDTHFASTWLLDKNAPSYKPPKVIHERWQHFKKRNKGAK